MRTPFSTNTRRKTYTAPTHTAKPMKAVKTEAATNPILETVLDTAVKFHEVMGDEWPRLPTEVMACAQHDLKMKIPFMTTGYGEERPTMGQVLLNYCNQVERVEWLRQMKCTPVREGKGICAWPFCCKELPLVRATDSEGRSTCLDHSPFVVIALKLGIE